MSVGSALAVQYVELASFTLLTVVAFVRRFSRKDIASGWLAVGYVTLAVPTALGLVLREQPTWMPPSWFVRLAVAVIVTFPFFLYRFLLVFERTPPRWQNWIVYPLIVATVGMAILVDPYRAATQRPLLWGITPYTWQFLVEFLVPIVIVAYRLFQAGRPLPAPARKRANLLTAGTATFGLALLLLIATQNKGQSGSTVAVGWLTVLSSWLFLIGVAPPSGLVRRWRRGEENAFREELVDIAFSGASALELRTVMLPKLAHLMGAARLDWFRPDGSMLATSGGPKEGNREVRLGLPDGGHVVIWSSAYTPFFSSELGTLGRTLGSMLHLSLERAASQEAAAVARRDLEEAQRIGRIGNWTWDTDSMEMSWSDEMYRLHGLPVGQVPPTQDEYMELVHPDDRDYVENITREASGTLTPYDAEYRVVVEGGEDRWLQIKGRVTYNRSGRAIALFGTCQDITERREMQLELTRQALHDDLTGLPNRTMLTDRLAVAVAEECPRGTSTAVLFIDVDRFKIINDSLGHEAGDAVLIEISKRIHATLRPTDTVARFGGDELVVLCTEVRDRQHALEIADRISAAAALPIDWKGKKLVVSLSIGVALSSVTGDDPSHLMRDADAAMYVAKQTGRARAVLFEGNIRADAVARLDTESELRAAVERGEFRLAYQPLIDLDTSAIVGFEALLRWQHPERGLVGPDEFLTVAEETGLIVPIGTWVLHEALWQLRQWMDVFPGAGDLRMAVNVAAQQLVDPAFHGVVSDALTKYGVAPGQLGLEITERVFADESPQTAHTTQSLADLGVRLAVDDFGVGYSSLAYLKRFPVHTLKIDRSFVADVECDPGDAAIIEAIIALAASLGLVTVAEGIENQGQRDLLRDLGCPLGQGYFFSRPVDAAGIADLLADSDADADAVVLSESA